MIRSIFILVLVFIAFHANAQRAWLMQTDSLVSNSSVIMDVFGEGFYRLRDELGEVLFSGNRFGVTREVRFELESLTALQGDKPKAEDFPFQVFPNPVRSEQLQLSFALSKRETVQFDLKDANGSALKKGVWVNLPPNTHHQSISLQTVPAGIYFLTLRAGQAIRTEKIIRIN